MTADLKDLKRRMHGAVEALTREFAGLRTGRASTGLLENLVVEAYGGQMPMNQLANISVPEARLLTVQVWDNGQVKAAERAIQEADLGLNPQTEGNLIRVPIPELSEERRTELTKVAARYAEQSRVAVRNVRRDGMEALKKAEKDTEISQDEHRSASDEIQKLTDGHTGEIDTLLATKEQEIMQV
ncbi:MAG: ribosome recycling factor [Alphaproteobacteria bacterium]|nr:ribosome recycling factor [Alphaproteobacteria bacterium]